MSTPHKKYTCAFKNLYGITKNASFNGNTNTNAITEAMLYSNLVRNTKGKTVTENMSYKLNVYDRWHGAPNGSGRSIQNKF